MATTKHRSRSTTPFRRKKTTSRANLQLREALKAEIREIIETRELKQGEGARLFGIGRTRLNGLIRGRRNVLFTLDGLVDMLARAGVRVKLTVQKSRSRR